MGKKLRVGVIFGGRSGEHEVSIRSAQAVIQGLDSDKFEVVPIGITKEGKWLPPDRSLNLLPSGTDRFLSKKTTSRSSGEVALLGDPSHKGLISLDRSSSDRPAERLDVVFPVLHGPLGEDGTLQGLLEMADVPYVGCGVVASSCGMDKVIMKSLFHEAGLPICRHLWFLRSEWQSEPAALRRKVKHQLGFPCFVKPANLGSSVGVSKAIDEVSLNEAVALAAQYDRKIIVEEALDAREIECAVIGNDEPRASLPGEYVVYQESARFLDYIEKYASTGNVEFVVPAPISKSMTARIQKLAIKVFKSVDGSGLARVDFFLRRDTNELLVNELNTLPGLTEVSGYPKMWAASGMAFDHVLETLIELAFERHRDKAQNKTSK
ncbi:MAG TPA: D-alanine--D-alanine ligase family protein [Pyrinomonadaceae bacterium]|nr:D-alanine--D-alanine ligase family protein [Pyrinomonadaceae bacterium]